MNALGSSKRHRKHPREGGPNMFCNHTRFLASHHAYNNGVKPYVSTVSLNNTNCTQNTIHYEKSSCVEIEIELKLRNIELNVILS